MQLQTFAALAQNATGNATCIPIIDGETYVPWIADIFGECVYSSKEIASFFIGLTSILLWMCAQFPQVVTNVRRQDVSSLSPIFLAAWLIGDSTNLIGSILTDQLATQKFTAVYFVSMDAVLLLQFAYYTMKNRIVKRKLTAMIPVTDLGSGDPDSNSDVKKSSSTPALTIDIYRPTASSDPIPKIPAPITKSTSASRSKLHKSSSSVSRLGDPINTSYGTDSVHSLSHSQISLQTRNSQTETDSEDEANSQMPGTYTTSPSSFQGLQQLDHHHQHYQQNEHQQQGSPARRGPQGKMFSVLLPVLVMFAIGSFGAMTMLQQHETGPATRQFSTSRVLLGVSDSDYDDSRFEWPLQGWKSIVGYAIGIVSAIFYLGSRVPQIIKNYKRKSVEGLSILLFIFAVTANSAYGISIFLFSVHYKFMLLKLPWLVGSMGVLVFDATLLSQYVLYRDRKNFIHIEQ